MLSKRQDAVENLIKCEETNLLATNDTQTAIDKISFYQNELENVVQNRTKGASVRNEARRAENGVKNTKYFLNLEKRNCGKKVIHKLKCGKSFIKTDQKEFLAELVDYYKCLYSESNCTRSQINDLDKYVVIKAELSKSIENQKLICDAPITLEECRNALNQLLTNKSFGMDGFIIEFYKTFCNDIKNCLFDSIAFLFNICKHTNSQYRGVVTLILKPDKDHLLACNYRPITLLNCN